METQLFFGLLLDDDYRGKLTQLSVAVKSLFIQDCDPDYLQFVQHEGKDYLGKYLGIYVEATSLNLMQDHIYSLLKRVVPDDQYKYGSLHLFAYSPQLAQIC